jgi:site-specific DNA recombinase
LDIIARRKIIRLLVKEILVGADNIIIRHSIPLANSLPHPPDSTLPGLPGRSFSDSVRGVPGG